MLCNILAVENSDDDWSVLEAKLAGQADVQLFRASTYKEAIEAVERNFYDVAMIDADLGDRSASNKPTFLGVNFARHLKEVSPLTVRILWTGHAMAARDALLRHLQPADHLFDFLLDKDTHPGYDINICTLRDSVVQSNWGLSIESEITDSELGECFGSSHLSLVKASLDAFLRRLFYTRSAGNAGDAQLISRVVLEHMTGPGGHSGALVVKVRVFADDQHCSMCVLKMARGSDVDSEERAYLRYVRYMLRRNRRVELLASVYNGRYGALLYTYAGAGSRSNDIRTLEELWLDGTKSGVVFEVVRQAFNPDEQEWYNAKRLQPAHSLRQHLLDHHNITEAVQDIEQQIAKIVDKSTLIRIADRGSGSSRLRVLGKFDLPNPADLLRKMQYDIKFLSCIGHGDLNLRNLLVVDKEELHWMVIDYEKTGRIHCLQDFYSLEASVRGVQKSQLSEQSVSAEHKILADTRVIGREEEGCDRDLASDHDLILEIRRLAFQNFRSTYNYEGWLREYLLGLVITETFVLTRRGHSDAARERMLFEAAYYSDRLSQSFGKKANS